MFSGVFLLFAAAVFFVWLAWRFWEWSVVVTVILIPTYLWRLSILSVPTNVLEVFVGVTFVVGLLQRRSRRSLLLIGQGISPAFKLGVLGFLAAAAIGTILSEELTVSLGILKGWIVIPIILGAMVLAAGQAGFSLKILHGLISSGVATAITGIWQLGKIDRVYGIYDVPNSLALWLAPITVMVIWVAINNQERNVWRIIVATILVIALIATQSVGGIVAVLVSLLVGVFVWLRGNWLKRGLRAVFVIFVISLFILLATGRMNYLIAPLQDKQLHNSISVRLQLWSVATQLLREQPITGIGLGQFEPAYQRVLHQRVADFKLKGVGADPIGEFVIRDPHNWILSFWLNLGLLGLVSFLVICFGALHKGRNLRTSSGQAVWLGLAVILVFGLIDTVYWKNDLAALFWVLVGLAISLRHGQLEIRPHRFHR